MKKERLLSAAIDPAGIGTTEILIRTFNDLYPRKWISVIIATNPVEAADKIINYIEKVKEKMSLKDFFLKEIIVKLPNKNIENSQENQATKELIGILRFYYKNKFRGHWLIQKQEGLKSFKLDVEKIMYLHFKEKENDWICESAWLKNLNVHH